MTALNAQQSTASRHPATFVPPRATVFWREIFGNDRSVSVEIGPGKGEFLLASARAHPERNYYAIERSRGRAVRLTALVLDGGLHNVCVIHADAACALRLLPDAAVAAYHVLFPDPWWKRRHHTRRLFTRDFVSTLCRTLAHGGTVELVSDVPAYVTLARQYLDAVPALAPAAGDDAPAISTSFARKARQRGVAPQRVVYRRIA